jgi:hypothetical protein
MHKGRVASSGAASSEAIRADLRCDGHRHNRCGFHHSPVAKRKAPVGDGGFCIAFIHKVVPRVVRDRDFV